MASSSGRTPSSGWISSRMEADDALPSTLSPRQALRGPCRPSRERRGRSVAVDDVADAEVVEDRALPPAAATRLRRGLVDAVGQAAQRQRLQPDVAGAGQRGEEEPLAAEERRLDLADELDVVVHGRLQGDETAGVHPQRLTRAEL